MKKSLLTLTIIGAAAAAFGQGALTVECGTTTGVQGFNTVSSNVNDSGASSTYSDYISSNVTLELFYATSAADASLVNQASTINADDQNAASVMAGVALLQADFTQVAFGTSSLTMQNVFTTSFGQITDGGNYNVGGTGAPTSGVAGLYAYLATTVIGGKIYEGAIVLNQAGPSAGLGGGAFPTPNAGLLWPNQNMLMVTTPEPTSLALAGLGGLSMLFLRRRKA